MLNTICGIHYAHLYTTIVVSDSKVFLGKYFYLCTRMMGKVEERQPANLPANQKADTGFMHLKTSESLKIHCGKEYFKKLDVGVKLDTATKRTELRKRI